MSRAVEAGVSLVNEMGLDPGIDHMLAQECIDQAKADGCAVESYVSYCGGLPAPECSDNPLRYKFSWSPSGVLLASISPAVFLRDNQLVSIPGGGGLMDAVTPMEFFPGFNFEGYPNCDSTKYAELYDIQDTHTLLRGTLRYKGFCRAMRGFVKLGLINSEPCPILRNASSPVTWKAILCHVMGLPASTSSDVFEAAVYERVDRDDCSMDSLKWFGMLSDDPIPHADSILTALSRLLEAKLSFGSGERDMIVLRSEFGLRHPTGELENKCVSLVVYGENGRFSAMAKTIGYPVAIAARMLLDGEICTKGVLLPISKEIYVPILKRLKDEGMNITTTSTLVEYS
ncbi:alpha-aminoadipic semialdehyde synthase, mitochondrial-like [Corythoichthys intestinalis]|uniref:alpha-aminoadipic semialdehyde synthase, mitochondrial-like n=1 Tax=Corythoichthys intestinalis TaxID=161448 RepID=UPI0025A6780E|nr:alpha-aminoadipic semialdehyde synthase, mitochondrial-like [Corythoichthys intestinalis]